MDEKYFFPINLDLIKQNFDWLNKPTMPFESDAGFVLVMDEKRDFWRETYYKPSFVKDDGHFVYKTFPCNENIMVETEFDLFATNQFDQAGIMVRIDEEHWIKTGIEYVDKVHKLSCVVTKKYSDWSTQNHINSSLAIRLYKIDQSYVVEAKQGDQWNFIRICHLENDASKNVMIGLYACSPAGIGGEVNFKHIKYKNVDNYSHSY